MCVKQVCLLISMTCIFFLIHTKHTFRNEHYILPTTHINFRCADRVGTVCYLMDVVHIGVSSKAEHIVGHTYYYPTVPLPPIHSNMGTVNDTFTAANAHHHIVWNVPSTSFNYTFI